MEAPKWGVTITFGCLNKIFSFAGSFSNTSKAAPATCPDSSAAKSASSSIRPPLAQFIICTPFFVLFRASAEMIFLVESVRGV